MQSTQLTSLPTHQFLAIIDHLLPRQVLVSYGPIRACSRMWQKPFTREYCTPEPQARPYKV